MFELLCLKFDLCKLKSNKKHLINAFMLGIGTAINNDINTVKVPEMYTPTHFYCLNYGYGYIFLALQTY